MQVRVKSDLFLWTFLSESWWVYVSIQIQEIFCSGLQLGIFSWYAPVKSRGCLSMRWIADNCTGSRADHKPESFEFKQKLNFKVRKAYETKFMGKRADKLVSSNWWLQHPVLPGVTRFQNICDVNLGNRDRGSAGLELEQRKHPTDVIGNVG